MLTSVPSLQATDYLALGDATPSLASQDNSSAPNSRFLAVAPLSSDTPEAAERSNVITNTVEIIPPDAAKRRTISWPGMAAEIAQTHGDERIEYRFRASAHLLIAYEEVA